VFDIATYLIMLFVIGPLVFGGPFASLGAGAQAGFIALFHAAWFVESLWTQTLVLHALRTPKIPFLQSRASWPVIGLTSAGIAVGTILPFTPLGKVLKLAPLPWEFFAFLVLVCVLYIALVTVVKKVFERKFGELL
jgi:Mg2+-importing ATPase